MDRRQLHVITVSDAEAENLGAKTFLGDAGDGYVDVEHEHEICACDGSIQSLMACAMTTRQTIKALDELKEGESLISEITDGKEDYCGSTFDRSDKTFTRLLRAKGQCALRRMAFILESGVYDPSIDK